MDSFCLVAFRTKISFQGKMEYKEKLFFEIEKAKKRFSRAPNGVECDIKECYST
jgi:hypothetical protein